MTPYERHVELCKKRALAILASGKWTDAVASMVSDLRTFPSGVQAPDPFLVGMLMMTCQDVESTKRFIEGF